VEDGLGVNGFRLEMLFVRWGGLSSSNVSLTRQGPVWRTEGGAGLGGGSEEGLHAAIFRQKNIVMRPHTNYKSAYWKANKPGFLTLSEFD